MNASDMIQPTEPTERPTAIEVIDSSRKNSLPTGIVTVTLPEGVSDVELAEVAGYCSRHWGYTVTRHTDWTATVALHND